MSIERGINDLQTIRRMLLELKGDIIRLDKTPTSEAALRRVGNLAGLLAQRIQERRLKERP